MESCFLLHPQDTDGDVLQNVKLDAEKLNLDCTLRAQPENHVLASILQYMLIGSVLFVSSAYLTGFLRELGKEHASLFSNFVKRSLLSTKQDIAFFSSSGKMDTGEKYVLTHSLIAKDSRDRQFKLIFPVNSENNISEMVEIFVRFIQALEDGELTSEVLTKLKKARQVGKIILVEADVKNSCVIFPEVINNA